ncbi:dihydrofolate reductase family protein [Petrotoga olearia]|uniref:Dihydrofolate reductase n=1 Tax=Petrotoga olearia TaxID=156203 RepID=A0ABX9UDD8_9BACT|nr:dihydrofolate reductase family protein [Petrotoga olearia]RMA73221.1 dihydrofolate reductase [Petrotoga olearia]
MRVKLIMVQSINGKIRIKNSSQRSWSSAEDREHFYNITEDIGVVVMGRKTFEEIGSPLKKRINIVLTGNPEKYKEVELKYGKYLYFTDNPPEILLDELEKKGYTEIALIGGSTINSLFLEKNLIDEIFLSIEPVIIEGDLSIFNYVNDKHTFKLNDVKRLNKDTILLHYLKRDYEE